MRRVNRIVLYLDEVRSSLNAHASASDGFNLASAAWPAPASSCSKPNYIEARTWDAWEYLDAPLSKE